MTPGARIQAAIELLDAIHNGTAPADRASAAYFRNRRYIGGKDRRDVLDHAYGVLRRRAALDWWIARAGTQVADIERARVIAKLLLIDRWSADKAQAVVATSPVVEKGDPAGLVKLMGKTNDFPITSDGWSDKTFFSTAPTPADYDPTARPWYKSAVSAGKLTVTKPYGD